MRNHYLSSLPPTVRYALSTALLLASCTLAAGQTAPNSATSYLSGVLANDARDTLRNADLQPASAATEASVLLESAVKLDATDLRVLHLLALTAQAARRTDARRDALRRIISADPGDLAAQMNYVDLLADASQNVEDRIGVYAGALAKKELDAQVRSEIALRLARLEEGRGDMASCRAYLGQAIGLNSVNVRALRDQVRLAAAEPQGPQAFNDHLQALTALLTANPYQPDAWLQVANICAAAGVHGRAAEFLQTAVEQSQIQGTPLALDAALDMSLELAMSGRRVESYTVAAGLSRLPDAPLGMLLTAELLVQDGLPQQPPPPTGTQPDFDRAAEIRKRLSEMARHTDDPAALADAAGADLTVFKQPGPDTATWVEAYAKLVKPEDATLARLKGWLAYRQNKLDEAQTILANATDPLARVGLARVLIAQGKPADAAAILQDLWNGNPTGLLALQIAETAQSAHLTLTDSPTARMVRAMVAGLTPALAAMHRQPLDTQLVSVNYRKAAVGVGEPVILQVRVTNTTDRPLPVGADGVVKSTVGLAAVVRGADAVPLGLYAVEDLQRVYRLEPHQMMESTVRVDQGKLADMLAANPGDTYSVNVTLVTAPRVLGGKEFSIGVGGQVIAAGDFQRGGRATGTPAALQQLVQEVTSQTGVRQLVAIDVAGALLAKKADADLSAALAGAAKSGDALVRATVVRAAPMAAGETLRAALSSLAADGDPLVRLMWLRHNERIMLDGGEPATAARAALEKAAGEEKDAAVKDYLTAALSTPNAPATQTGNK